MTAIAALVLTLAFKGFTCVPRPDQPPPPLALPAQAVGAVPTMVCTFLCAFSVLPLETEVIGLLRGCYLAVTWLLRGCYVAVTLLLRDCYVTVT